MREAKHRAVPTCLGRRRALATLMVFVAAGLVVSQITAATAEADTSPDEHVTLIADSVGLGVRDHLHEQFPDDWEIDVIGRKSLSIGQLEQRYVRPRLDQFGDYAVVAAGYNFPFDGGLAASIDSMVDTLTDAGVEHVFWVTLREVREEILTEWAWRDAQRYYWTFPVVNAELDEALGRHPELTLIDWSAAADRPGLTVDAIHLDREGIDLYGSLIKRAIDDTMTRRPNGGVTRVDVARPGDVAAGDVAAVALNVTSVRGRDAGYLSAYPCEEDPQTSNLNHRRDAVVAAAAIVRVGPSGDVCVHNQQAGHVVIDVFGRFGADADLLDVEATRALDTRDGWPLLAATEHPVTVVDPADIAPADTGPADPDQPDLDQPDPGQPDPDQPDPGRLDPEQPGAGWTVVLNVTAVRPWESGYATVHGCGAGPGETSNVNFERESTTPNLVVARTDAEGRVCLTSTTITDALVDVLAVLGPESTVTATAPSRLVDTRHSDPRAPDGTVVIDVSDNAAASEGIVANLTITGAAMSGYATVYPCSSDRTDTSNINFGQGAAVANAVIVEPDVDGLICVFTSIDAEVILDLMATTGSGFDGIVPVREADSRRGPSRSD